MGFIPNAENSLTSTNKNAVCLLTTSPKGGKKKLAAHSLCSQFQQDCFKRVGARPASGKGRLARISYSIDFFIPYLNMSVCG
jgi:hypothetical protein